MSNKILTICSSVILTIIFIAPGFADEHFPFQAEVSKESVNVRAGPNANFEKIDKLSKGSRVVVLGRTYEWYKVQPLPTTKEYIRSDYLNINEGGVAVVTGDNVNVRCEPSSTAASLGEVKKGALVKVLEQVKGWCRLTSVAGTAAWIHQDFLKEISPDVPVSMLVPTVQHSTVTVVNSTPVKTVTQTVTLQGMMQALPVAASDDVHYEIMIDEKTIYYLKDIPQISFFANKVVTVEGAIIPDPPSHAEDSSKVQKKFLCPLVHINKIALVI